VSRSARRVLLVSSDPTAARGGARERGLLARGRQLFWIGRYAERAEGLVRLLRVAVIKLTERTSFTGGRRQRLHATRCWRR
jgi:hypothetical protein